MDFRTKARQNPNRIKSGDFRVSRLQKRGLARLFFPRRFCCCCWCLDRLNEGGNLLRIAVLRVVLCDLAVLKGHDGWEGLNVELGLDEVALLVAAVLGHRDPGRAELGRERVVLVLHRLAELAPGGVDDHDRGVAARLEGQGAVLVHRLNRLGGVPEVAVEGLLGALHVDAALRLGRPVLVLQAHEAPLPLRGVVEPRRLVALPLEVDELGGAVLGDRDRVLGVPDRGVALGVERVRGDLVLGDVVEGVLEGPVGQGVDLGQAAVHGRVLEEIDPRALEPLPAGPAVDHAVCLEGLEAAAEGLHLAHLVVLLDVLLPQVRPELLVVLGLVGAALRLENLRLEAVVLLHLV
mmetsp:Transcript_65970/g.148891  ORF Transcript_65970/g.148891 Transcript_65970/m.148891 type:complete len:350 (-) Transcript_65970:403-1452(-)